MLVVDGTLAGRLNDERFASLMRYCGRLKRLEVHDAPKSFEGNCFSNRTLRSTLQFKAAAHADPEGMHRSGLRVGVFRRAGVRAP